MDRARDRSRWLVRFSWVLPAGLTGPHSLRFLAVAGMLLAPTLMAAGAQEPPARANAAPIISAEAVQKKITDLEGSVAVDEDTKARLLDLYARIRAAQDVRMRHETAEEQFTRARETAAEEARTIRAQMEQGEPELPTSEETSTTEVPPGELEAELVKAKTDLTAVETQLGEIRQALAAEANRPAEARQSQTQVRQRLEAIQNELKAPEPAGAPAAMRGARVDLLQSESLALGAESRMLEQELLSQPMRITLLEAQRDRDEQRLRALGALVVQLEARVGAQRIAEAERIRQEAEQVQRRAEGKHPKVQDLADRNATLGEEIAVMARELELTIADAKAAKERSERVLELFSNIRRKLEIAGLSEALGQIMLEQRRRLMDIHKLRRRFKQTTHTVAQEGLRQLRREEERQELRDPAAYLQALIEDLEGTVSPVPEDELMPLVESRKLLISQALDLGQTYLRALGELDHAQRELLDAATRYRAYLDERLLWVRSTPGPKLDMITRIPAQLASLVAPDNWAEVWRALAQKMTRPSRHTLILVLLAIGTVARPAMYRRLVATGKYIRKPSRDRFAFTLQALMWTLLIAAPLPLFFYLVGRALGSVLSTGEFVGAISVALCHTAKQFYVLAALRVACLPSGLSDKHFGWPDESLDKLRRRLARFMWVFLPAAFITNLAVAFDASTMGGGLSWVGFLVLSASVAAFASSLFQPRTGVLRPHMETFPNSFLTRLNKVWTVLVWGISLSLALLATLGYRYTAIVLLEKMVETLSFTLAVILLHQLILRWLVLSRRKLAVQAALARRKAALAEEESGADGSPAPDGGSSLNVADEPKIDLVALGEETRQLLLYFVFAVAAIGIWMIWSTVLPAFGYLDQVELWARNGIVDGEAARVPVTLADLLLAVLIGITTVVVTKRLPALLEITLLQRLHLTPGARYAAKTLSSYAIILVGILIALSRVGITWSQVQWLVAALGVGIGFGLQEIVANFISGLIILFERPIRVGDVITVGETDGVVTRIQIRATTIRNWERKELLVPNKEFITGRLLNWSLSDQTTRIFISVGLAYGGDVTRAMSLMAKAAETHHRILADPVPFVSFEGFGDNALILNLRCYTDSLESRLHTTSELYEAINTRFNDAGLVIAFPQRDVHLNTSSPLEVRIQPGAATPGNRGDGSPDSGDRS